jgi:hypothetical protein
MNSPSRRAEVCPFGKVVYIPYSSEPLKPLHCAFEFQWRDRCTSMCLPSLCRWKPCDDAIRPSNNHNKCLRNMYIYRRYFSTRKGQAVQTVKSEEEEEE